MRVEHLDESHDLSGFDSGEQSLDAWLRNHALGNDRRDLSRTFVLVDDDDGLIGYYSLTQSGVPRQGLPNALARGLPPVEIGAVLIGRLAIDQRRQGQGLGRDLLIDAIRVALASSAIVAARFVAVDPLHDEARQFYAKFGFKGIPGDVRGRMYLRLDEAKLHLDA